MFLQLAQKPMLRNGAHFKKKREAIMLPLIILVAGVGFEGANGGEY